MLMDRRLAASRLLVVPLLVYVIVAGSPLLPRNLLEHEYTHELVSLLLVIAGAFGRVWASLYLGGRKNATLVQAGPYSLCRNPLYFFSAVGALGIAIQSHRVLVALARCCCFCSWFIPGPSARKNGAWRRRSATHSVLAPIRPVSQRPGDHGVSASRAQGFDRRGVVGSRVVRSRNHRKASADGDDCPAVLSAVTAVWPRQ